MPLEMTMSIWSVDPEMFSVQHQKILNDHTEKCILYISDVIV